MSNVKLTKLSYGEPTYPLETEPFAWALFFRFSDGWNFDVQIKRENVSPQQLANSLRAMAGVIERQYADKETKDYDEQG